MARLICSGVKKNVFTPDLSQSGVDGIMCRRITEYLATSDYRLHYVTESIHTLANADEIIVCNALMPLFPVVKVNEWTYQSRQLYNFLNPHC